MLRDEVNRFAHAQPDVERTAHVVERLHELDEFEAWARLPRRLVHNDAKAVNVVHDQATSTVIDLDTTMPGPLLADLGELCHRPVCRTAPEDDDRATNALQPERFGLVVRGWLTGYGRPLHDVEAATLPIAGIVLTVEEHAAVPSGLPPGRHLLRRRLTRPQPHPLPGPDRAHAGAARRCQRPAAGRRSRTAEASMTERWMIVRNGDVLVAGDDAAEGPVAFRRATCART